MEIDIVEVEQLSDQALWAKTVCYLLLGGRMLKVGMSSKMNLYGVYPDDQNAHDDADVIYTADRDAAIKFREEAVITHLGYPAYHPDVIKEMASIRATPFLPDWQSNFRAGFVTINPAAETWIRVQAVPFGRVFGKRPWAP